MSSAKTPPSDIDKLIGDLTDGLLDQAGMSRLEAILEADPEARQRYYHLMSVHTSLNWRFGNGLQNPAEASLDPGLLFEVVEEQARLTKAQPDAEPDWIAQLANGAERDPKSQGKSIDKDTITARQLFSLTGYLLGQALTTKLAYKAYGIAAAILLAATLFLVFGRNADDARPDPLAGQVPAINSQPDPQSVSTTTPVASLTAEHNAVWSSPQAEGALAPGSQLRAGQRLTLTQGFAEITTARGAVAILEAPATIELLDSNNALHLHAGKLVGICETPTSKGFLVRTPHMDITDLGTRFGVDASKAGETRVEVFEGEVEAAIITPAGKQAQPRRLTSGQALAAQQDTGWTTVAYEPNRFAIAPDLDRYRPDFAGTNAAWLGKVAGDLGQDKQRADTLQVFLEQAALPLEPVAVDVLGPGTWDVDAEPVMLNPQAGERVDVYLLHFDLPPFAPASGVQRNQDFVIKFDRPILGVIATQEGLDATDPTLGQTGVVYPAFSETINVITQRYGLPRGLNANDRLANKHDRATIDADGQTLRLSLFGGDSKDATMDQLRVIVRAAEDQP